jgi:thiol:disulfide interchange protein DsbD
MIPITAGILQAQASSSLLHNFFSSLVYVVGMATVYAFLGYLSATTSMMFGSWLAAPWFLVLIIGFFLYLAFSMLGFYELQLPAFLMRSSASAGKKSLLHLFVLGLFSGTIASPCLTPALAMLLGIVAKQANPLVGLLTLFCFALGMGILLLLIGTFSGSVSMLPKAGSWMNEVKKMFGFLMLAMCIYFLQGKLSINASLWAYAGISTVASIVFFTDARQERLAKGLAAACLLIALAVAFYAIK